jgi:hypothetical protein
VVASSAENKKEWELMKEQQKEEEEDWRNEMDKYGDWHINLHNMTPEEQEELDAKMRNGFSERWDRGRKNWSLRDWWEDYKYEVYQTDIRNTQEVEMYRENLRKLRKRAREIRDTLAERLAKVPQGEGITTKDLILESHKLIRILVECGWSDIYHPYAVKFIHRQIRRIIYKDYKLYPGVEFFGSLPMPVKSGTASYAASVRGTTIANVYVEINAWHGRRKTAPPTMTRAWFNCTEEQFRKVIELDYKRRMGVVKSVAWFYNALNKPFDMEEALKELIEKEPRSVWRDEMIKLIEEEKRKNPHNRKLEEEKDKQEREKWK